MRLMERLRTLLKAEPRQSKIPAVIDLPTTDTITICGHAYQLAALTEEQNRRLWTLPDLAKTTGEQWEGTLRTSLINAGNPIDQRHFDALSQSELSDLVGRIGNLTYNHARNITQR